MKSNREVLVITYFFLLLFLGLIVYYCYFIGNDSKDVVNNTYNRRSELLAETVVRGKILGKNGEVLAETKTDEEGKEYRYYPYNDLFAHIVGRTQKGATGIEQSENITLLTSGNNAFSNAMIQMKGEKIQGDHVITTLDVDLQKAAYDALGNQRGAAVVMEPSTGRILAMVSKPDYDPNLMEKYWDALNEDTVGTPLLNRATQGLYPPGSTFKILTSLAYMRQQSGYKKYSYNCEGKGIYSSVSIECYDQKVHGTEDFIHSFANSCNTSYANIGTKLDLGEYRKVCESFLFNRSLPTTIPSKQSSFVLEKASKAEDVPQTAIGQGKTQITPLLNCMIAATIANDGVMMCPYVVDRVETSGGRVHSQREPESYKRLMTKKEAKYLTKMMRAVVTEGTGSYLNGASYTVAGKTGSAEYDSTKATHSWFVGFAPADEPKVAICVLVENTGNGNVYSLPVVKQILDTYFRE